ncbi:MAG: hypothetical protein V2A53_03880 [bacterium]
MPVQQEAQSQFLLAIYTEAVYVNKRIALVGVETPTIIAGGFGNTVTFEGNTTNNASISGFMITGAIERRKKEDS